MSETNTYKIILVGDAGVGKTNIVQRFVDQKFSYQEKPTIGVEFYQKTVTLQGHGQKKTNVLLQIWDTAGQERYRGLVSSYYRNAQAVLMVFDTTSQKSFENVSNWLQESQTYCEQAAILVLIGNKKDLVEKRSVKEEAAVSLCQKHNMRYFETSAKDNSDQMIDTLFNWIALQLNENFGGGREFLQERLSKKKMVQIQPEEQRAQEVRAKKCCV